MITAYEKRFPKPKDSASVESLYWEKRRQGWRAALEWMLDDFNFYSYQKKELEIEIESLKAK